MYLVLQTHMNKRIGFIGLGKMGQNMVLHLLEEGIGVVGYNRTKEVTTQLSAVSSQLLAKGSFTSSFTVPDFLSQLRTHNPPLTTDNLQSTTRIVWLMVPNGKPV